MSKNLEFSVLCDIYGNLLAEKQKTALELYYNEDLSLSEIAEHTGISRQGVREQIKHAEGQLAFFESALGLYEKSAKTEKIINRLEQLAAPIGNNEISELIGKLKSLNE